ncbi:MAG: chain length determinant protein tyrosine kinase EpsG [Betaproteobacteria bacterium]|nr:MAG: chain length determinant protein tyrosine kinase EpsG [Betaproteobacteria bacterium]TMG77077.1 MAG: chain length determinant protein tyrosine kinase EpsG [Betaproteobacteria bacterium]
MNVQENVLPIEGSSRVLARHDRRIGSILAEEGKLGGEDIERVMELQQTEGLRFGEAALRLGLITADDLRCAVAKQYDLPHLLPGNESISSELVVAYEPFHPRAEELRALRTQLLMRWSNTKVGHRVLAIVSPGSGEGRSYVAANLAVVFSQLGERTLLIDADLRTPRQHRIFNVPDRIGLSAVLSGRADRSAITQILEFGRLSLLPAGAPPPNPQELLSRPSLGVLLQEMWTEFDIILIDTPPAKLYADAQSVTFRAGSAMMLARKDHTRLADTASVIRELSDTGARIVGTVFNAF